MPTVAMLQASLKQECKHHWVAVHIFEFNAPSTMRMHIHHCHDMLVNLWHVMMQQFLKYHAGEELGKAAGTIRDNPYSNDLLQAEAPLATVIPEWVGENFPGWPTKTDKLVRCQDAFQ